MDRTIYIYVLKTKNLNVQIAGDCLPKGKFKLHSAFANAANFINSSSEVLGLVNNHENITPNALCIPGVDFSAISCIEVDDLYIFIEHNKIERSRVPEFESEIRFSKDEIFKIENLLKNIRTVSISSIPQKSLMALYFPQLESQFSSGFDKAFLCQSKLAFQQFQNGKVLEGIAMFRGIGYGFTPSGDDFNAGFLFGLNILEEKFDKDFSEFKHQVYNIAKGGNPVVNTFLLLAMQARYFNRLKKTLFLLPGKDKTATSEAFQPLLMHGETSGADLLAGLITAVHYKTIL